MNNILQKIVFISVLLLSLCFQSCELFNLDNDDANNSQDCNTITMLGSFVHIEYSDYQDLGPTVNCNHSMQIDFYNGFENSRNNPSGYNLSETGTRVELKLRTIDNNIALGTYT